MNVQVDSFDPIRVVMLRHTGPYDGIGPLFEQLWDWVTKYGVPAQRTIGIYWDNPDYVAASRLRSAACVEIPSYFQAVDTGGLPIEVGAIAGGTYATTRFVGPYEDLADVWTRFTSYIEGGLNRTIRQDPAFEVYVNDASTTPSQQLITDLYMPVF